MKDLVVRRGRLRDREERIDVVHLFADDQFVRPILIQPIEEAQDVRIEHLARPDKHRHMVKALYIAVDRADPPVPRIQVTGPVPGDDPQGIGAEERKLIERLKKAVIPSVVAVNFCDDGVPDERARELFAEAGLPVCYVSAKTGMGIEELKKTIADNAEYDGPDLGLIKGLVGPGETAVLVVPVDKAAPKGRLILPQQQTIRDLLDHKAMAVIAQPETLESVLENMKTPPKIVITDSQAFSEVAKRVPAEIPMTSFSILFARQKGDLRYLREGAAMIRKLKAGDKVLVLEGCTHHRQEDDIGTVKIPRLIRKAAGQDIQFEWYRGNSLPDHFDEYALIVHCGACMLNRREMQYRLRTAAEQDVPVTNYGMAIAEVLGILPRAMEPFGNLSK